MKSQETKQSQQGQVSTQATEPKDSKQEHLEFGVAKVLEKVSGYAPAFRLEVLEAALNQTAKVTQSPGAEPEEIETPEELQESADQPEGNPTLFALKKWLRKRNYTEKLTAVVVSQLITVESMYEKPDDLIGNDFDKQFTDDVIEASTNEVYLKNAPPDEIAVTAFILALLPVRV